MVISINLVGCSEKLLFHANTCDWKKFNKTSFPE